MAEHEPNTGKTDEWWTPPEIFEALGETFDLDPCSPMGKNDFVPATIKYTKQIDGLTSPWHGFVWMNPPFGKRNGHVAWLRKFVEHGNGLGLVRAYTSSKWFHDWIPKVDAILFPRGKTKFVRPDGTVGRSPGHGVVLLAMGERACEALRRSGLGIYYRQ